MSLLNSLQQNDIVDGEFKFFPLISVSQRFMDFFCSVPKWNAFPNSKFEEWEVGKCTFPFYPQFYLQVIFLLDLQFQIHGANAFVSLVQRIVFLKFEKYICICLVLTMITFPNRMIVVVKISTNVSLLVF